MNTTFRVKLLAIFGVAMLGLLIVMVLGVASTLRQERELSEVQSRLVPKAELGPRVEAELERITRSLQDAVAAQDSSGLDAAAQHKTALFELLGRAGAALEPAAAAAIRWAVQDYYETARDVSRRMIAGEPSETLVSDVARMQAQQAKAAALIKRTTSLDREVLGQAFTALRAANESATRVRLGVMGAGMALTGLLAFWGARGMLQTLSNLSEGFNRFGRGDFRHAIPITSKDELGILAREANQMAASLQQSAEQRDDEDWIKAGLVALSEELRGELEPAAVAERALAFLAPRLGALVGALYLREEDGLFHLRATYAVSKPLEEVGPAARVREGEGVLGQAIASGEVCAIDELPSDFLRVRSALGEMAPRQVVLAPLVDFGRKAGAIELGLSEALSPPKRSMLLAVRAMLVSAIETAQAGAVRRALLFETQAQAERLQAQEEELRLNNQELLTQGEALRLSNQELEQQRQEQARQNQQLERARTVLQEKADELDRVSSYKSQFLANMSHELRTPLNSMLLLSQVMAENETGNLSSKQIEHLRTIHSAGQDLLGLINQVLDLSKIESGKQDLTLESIDVQHFVGFARRLFEQAAIHKGLVLETEIDPAAPTQLVSDRQRIERILINLLGNALKFTERGRVTLRIARPERAVRGLTTDTSIAFEVSDTGAGIPESARERIFAPFEQVQGDANRGHTGTGLGLTIARESARLMGGELMLEHSSEHGSRFACIVPLRPEKSLSLGSRLPEGPRLESDAGELGAEEPHLLVIEDDSVLAEQLVEIAQARGLKALVVGTAEEGLRLARMGKTLGIILDVKLPDFEGWAVMETLKQDALTRSIPVHFVSGIDEPQRGLALGALGYLVKPASHAELASMLRRLVPEKQSGGDILVVEDDAQYAASVLAVLARDGFSAEHAPSGKAALEALGTGRFGCIILDLGLPDMDGVGLLETLRSRPEIPPPRVVIHTGRALSRQETRELEAYAEAVVLKHGGSAERLLEEVRLFVRHVKDRVSAKIPLDRPRPVEAPRVDVSLRGVKLLLAEDDMRTVYSLSALLRSRGAEVVTAETGSEALTALSAHSDIQGVLMDIMMPEMDGYEAMRQLRRDPRFGTLPVIALTAKAMKGERERCLEAGASEYLPKPVDGDRLLLTLRDLLAKRGADA